MSHFSDIIQEQVSQAVSEATSGTKTPTKPTSNVTPTGPGASTPAPKKGTRRILTREQQKYADDNGVSYEAAYRYFNEK